jgi:hypothetical protein
MGLTLLQVCRKYERWKNDCTEKNAEIINSEDWSLKTARETINYESGCIYNRTNRWYIFNGV